MRLSPIKPRKHAVTLAMWMVVPFVLCALVIPEIEPARGDTAPIFTKDIAPILFKNCVRCHSPGEIASSVPLISYETVRPRAESIKQRVMAREMPPWPADPARSLKFRNDPRLIQQEIDTIVAWVNSGAHRGDDADLPPTPKFEDGWEHPFGLKPDLVVSLPGDVHLPAEGAIPYVRLLVKIPFVEDRWIAAIQTKPSNPAVVHHMALTEVSLPPGVSPAGLDQLASVARRMGLSNTLAAPRPAVVTQTQPEQIDMLGIYTPGTTLERYGDDSGKLLRGGSNMYLIFNIHYETIGTPQTDRSRVAFWFLPRPPRHQLYRVNGAGETILANGKELLTDEPGIKAEGTPVVIPPIPPFANNYELTGVTGYVEPITIYQLQPHAHHRGKDFTYRVVYPDGREQTLLTIPRYDHMSQVAYELETPLKLPAGSKLVVTAHYDNSTKNMHNPAPDKPVYFRDMNQSWDEMFTPFVQISFDQQGPDQQAGKALGRLQDQSINTAQQQGRTEAGRLEIGEVVGCLGTNAAGDWLLTNAGQPMVSETEATSSAALKAAEARPLGSQRYDLLGVNIFNPSNRKGEKVAVKGILINNSSTFRINVTSLQSVSSSCVK